MIKLLVIGNLGKDAVVNNVNGKSVINFSVAHTEKYKDAQGNQKDRTVYRLDTLTNQMNKLFDW